MSEKVRTHKFKQYPGAMVWQVAAEPDIYYLTQTRGKNRSTFKLDAETMEQAIAAAEDFLK